MSKTKIPALLLALVMMIACFTACGKKTYKVRFESDGKMYHSEEVGEGSDISAPITPTKTGYDFIGWYYNGQKWRFDFDTVVCDMILEAKWKINLKKTFFDYSGVGIDVASDGSYMTLDTNPYNIDKYVLSGMLDTIKKANSRLGFTDGLYQKMLSTTALQGRQTYENDLVTVQWTYHPDNGLEVIYEVKK